MNSLAQYFGAAYVINLPERRDRLNSAIKEFARTGWPFGPEGIQLYSAKKFTDRAGFPFIGSRGCFDSHSECIRNAHRQGKKSVLVMEDDIALASSMLKLTPSVIAKLEASPWDFLYLGHEDTGDIGRATLAVQNVDFVPFDGTIRGAHCYAVNARIFARLLAHLDRVAGGIEGDQMFGPMPIDGAFNIFRRINDDVKTFMAVPKLCWQRSTRSDNHPRAIDNIRPLRPVISMLRNVRSAAMRWYS